MRCSPKRREAARELRRNSTPGETALWKRLRAHRLDGLKFRRQFPVGPYFLDFYCPGHRLAVEVDGDYHDEPDQAEYDAERTLYLDSRGITVLRFSNAEVLATPDAVARKILAALRG